MTSIDLDLTRYVATQAPIPDTFEDFWRMVWELNASQIVMLTKEVCWVSTLQHCMMVFLTSLSVY